MIGVSRRVASGHRVRAISVGASLIVATMLLAGCGGTLPSFQPGASLPDLPSRPTAGPTEKPPAQATEKPSAEQTEKPPKPTDKPTQKPPAEQTEKPPAQATEKPPAEPTEEPAAEPTASPSPGSGDNSGGSSPWLILLVVVLAIGLAVALYALYRRRDT